MILANRPTKARKATNRPVQMTCPVTIEAAAQTEEGGDDNLPTFSMVAYTGGPMQVGYWRHPVLVDLKGLDVTTKSRPVFKDHYSGDIVGHTTSIEKRDGQLYASGVISGGSEVADDVVRKAKNGFPWQASIGASAKDVLFVDKDSKVEANGRTHEGPLYFVRKSRLSEISFVALGADDNSSATVAAQCNQEGIEMEFEKWLEALGFNAEGLSDNQINALKASFEAEQADSDDDEEVKAKATDGQPFDFVAEQAKHARYVAQISAACAGDADLLAEALENRWSVEEAKLRKENKDLKASRSAPPHGQFAIHSRESNLSDEAIVAGLAMQLGVSPEELKDPLAPSRGNVQAARSLHRSSERPMTDAVIEAADRQFRNIGLLDACRIVAQRENRWNGMFGDTDGLLRASFTTLSLPTVFQQALNRVLLSQYQMSSFNWRSITRATSVPDFRSVERFRVHGTGHWERLSPSGELKQGQIEEGDKYSIKAETIGQMMMLTREDFINDDLGALNRIASQMTFYGSLAPEIETFKTLLANDSNFFHANNDNLVTGAGTAFGLQGLEDLWTKFRKRRDRGVSKDKVKPGIDVTPRVLVVPVELELEAQTLLGQRVLGIGGAEGTNGLITTTNPFYNKFSIVSSIYLSDSNVHANASATAYYLLADPAFLPAIEIAFLNGKQRPTIETVEPRPEVLGMGFRGWFDFGVKLMDPKAAAKAAGA